MDDQNKNLIIASVLSFLVIVGWFFFFPPPQTATVPDTPAGIGQTEQPGVLTPPGVPGAPGTTAPAPAAEAPRIAIATPRLSGTVSLTGGRIDDLELDGYRETTQPDSPLVRLLSPVGGVGAYYALYGWSPGGTLGYEDVPGPNTPWTVAAGDTLGIDTPVTLEWNNGKGLIFRQVLSLDANYMFTATQSVENTTGAEVRLAPYGVVARHGLPAGLQNFFILHEGVIKMTDGKLQEIKYKNMPDLDMDAAEGGARAVVTPVAENGWVGFTDKYWMTTLIPMPGQAFTAVAKYTEGAQVYQTEARLPAITVAPGATGQVQTMLFAGAKEWETIRNYQDDLHIDRFLDSIDWGWFFFLTKPIFRLLHWLHSFIGNMGWSIIALTFVLKALVLPLAYKSYVSMARMKELQPEMEKLKEQAGDDRLKLQQGMMALYKERKVNPAAGCLPILVQIPIFFSLYKVIFVTIELRHAPWVGWIRDLSAPDPSSLYNLFGLLPWAAPEHGTLLATVFLGVLPICLGVSMWLQQKLNPTPPDPTQAMIFSLMPWVFMFMLGSFASGLVLYWITNNLITFMQQYAIMRSHGAEIDLFGNIKSSFKRKPAATVPKGAAPDAAKPANRPANRPAKPPAKK